MIGIYKIENLVNGKKYIGQSTNITKRWQQHLEVLTQNTETAQLAREKPLYAAFIKYGLENFSFQIIEICNYNILDEREKYWIKYYNSFINAENSQGYNLTIGGEGKADIKQEEIQTFSALWEQGYCLTEISKKCNRSIDFVRRGLLLGCKTYSLVESEKRGKECGINKHSQIIRYYDFLGNFIKEYSSIKEAATELKISEDVISYNLKYKTKMCHNGYFIRQEENQKEALERHMEMKGGAKTPVAQMGLDNNILNYFISASEASRFLNKENTGLISACCAGRVKTAYGFKWRFVNKNDYQGEI